MRIHTLLQKISDLAGPSERPTVIDVDLMLDYTRVLYADLLEWRGKVVIAQRTPMPVINEPTLDELAAAMKEEETATEVRGQPQPGLPPVSESAGPPAMPGFPQPAASGNAPAPDKDIRRLISINEKYQIMSELFGNDKDEYEAALNRINESGSEAAAVKWLQDGLWVAEERSDAMTGFYDLVNRFFRTQAIT